MKNCLLWFLVFPFLFTSCTHEKKREWIQTENGYYLWGLKASDDAIYHWEGDTISCIAHGKGKLRVVQDDGEYTNVAKVSMDYGSMKKSDWKHTIKGEFLGEMKDNKPQGFGVLKENGITYIGEFAKGKLDDGFVTIIEHDTLLYKGGYSNGKYHGEGTLYKHGDILYIGEFKKGLYHGFGKLFSDSSLVYIGSWKNGLYHGKGILYKNGKATKGKWSKGIFEKPLWDRSLEQMADQWNALIGKNIKTNKSDDHVLLMANAERFVMDSLTSFVSRIVREKVKENVEDRFGITSLPRMLWQKLFTGNTDRMTFAQDAFIKNITPVELESVINEKIRFYNESSDKLALNKISFLELKPHEIVTEDVFKLIQTRETMEYTDLLLGFIIDIVVGLVIGFIIGLITTKSMVGGWLLSIPGIIVGFVFAIFTTGKAETKLEENITQQVVENYMNYINKQDIINKTLY